MTESQHLVDIINQTDGVEDPSGEEKLGELMLNFAWITKWGTLDFFVMPGFRERTFPGREGRFRTLIPMDLSHAEYESSLREFNTDLAVRYAHRIGDWDIGLLAEYLFDTRLDTAQTPFSNDLFAGMRVSFNDKQSTNILGGVIVDPETAALAIGLEAERRLWRGRKRSLEGRIFSGVPRDDPLCSYQKDDYLQAVLAWYF